MDWECLDLPAWPVHPSHHAFHCVPPQDGNAQFLDGIGVRCGLVAAAGSLLVKSIVERSPQTGTGNHNDSLPSRFACTGQICFIQSILYPLFAQQWGEGILFQGVVFSLAHGQCHWHRIALEQECCGKNEGHDGLSHGEDLPSTAKPWCCGWASLQCPCFLILTLRRNRALLYHFTLHGPHHIFFFFVNLTFSCCVEEINRRD